MKPIEHSPTRRACLYWTALRRRGELVPCWTEANQSMVPNEVIESQSAVSAVQSPNKSVKSPSSLYLSFVLLILVSLVLWWHTLGATFGLALRADAYTHTLVIIPLSIALIFTEWRSRKAKPEPNFRTGLALLALAILISFIGGRWRGLASLPADVQLSLEMLAVVTWWIGSFVGCFGTRISRASAFPLCFLLWLVPIPDFALSHIVSFRSEERRV